MSLEKIYNNFVSRFNKHKEEDTQEVADKKVESIIINGIIAGSHPNYSGKNRFTGIIGMHDLISLRYFYKTSSYYRKDSFEGSTLKIEYKNFLITINDIDKDISVYSIIEISDKD